MENGFCEAFTARLREQLRSGEVFCWLREARIGIRKPEETHTKRPRSALGYRPAAPEAIVPMEPRPFMPRHRHWTPRVGRIIFSSSPHVFNRLRNVASVRTSEARTVRRLAKIGRICEKRPENEWGTSGRSGGELLGVTQTWTSEAGRSITVVWFRQIPRVWPSRTSTSQADRGHVAANCFFRRVLRGLGSVRRSGLDRARSWRCGATITRRMVAEIGGFLNFHRLGEARRQRGL